MGDAWGMHGQTNSPMRPKEGITRGRQAGTEHASGCTQLLAMAGGANHHVYHCAFGVTGMAGLCRLRAREGILRVIRPEMPGRLISGPSCKDALAPPHSRGANNRL